MMQTIIQLLSGALGSIGFGLLFHLNRRYLPAAGVGGLLAWLIMCLLRPVFHKEHLWLCSPVAALFHNLGQLLVAAAIMRTWAVLAYLPYLALSGVITGLFTGLCTQFLMARLEKLH